MSIWDASATGRGLTYMPAAGLCEVYLKVRKSQIYMDHIQDNVQGGRNVAERCFYFDLVSSGRMHPCPVAWILMAWKEEWLPGPR